MADAQPAAELSWAEASVHFVEDPGIYMEVHKLRNIWGNASDDLKWRPILGISTAVNSDVDNADSIVKDKIPESHGDVVFLNEMIKPSFQFADTAFCRILIRAEWMGDVKIDVMASNESLECRMSSHLYLGPIHSEMLRDAKIRREGTR